MSGAKRPPAGGPWHGGWTLTHDQVPDPPTSKRWVDHLRWALCVIDGDQSGAIAFLAGCLAYAARPDGGLTDRQAAACNRILKGLCAAHAKGGLACQLIAPGDDNPLASMEAEGSA